MTEQNRDEELPQRVKGAARRSPARSAPSSALSDELRQRMRAAVEAERAGSGNGSGKPAAVADKPARVRRPPAPEPAGRSGLAVNEDVTERSVPSVRPGPGRPHPAGTERAAPRRQVAPPPPAAKAKPRRRPGRAWLAALAAATLVTASLAVVAVRHFTRPPASSAAQLRQQAAVRDQAAAWVVKQVSRDVIVSCDQAMCRALTARGFPGRDLVVLSPTSPDPNTTDVVVETAVVQGLFGSSLAAAWAPDVLASFGSGTAAVTVRVVARHGAASYRAALRADQADRKTAGAALLSDIRIGVADAARRQLAAGRVDSRLILAIASLASAWPIDIVQFGDTGPGADPDIPLRYADLAENDQATHMNRTAYVKAMRASLDKLTGLYRPAGMATVTLGGGPVVLRVEFTAPSPVGLLGPQTSS